MDRDTVIRLARESGLFGILDKYAHEFLDGEFDLDMCGELERFAVLIEQHAIFSGTHTCNPDCQRPACVAVREAVAAEREKAAHWMMERGYATGHGDSMEDLLNEVEWQVREREREACAKVCETEWTTAEEKQAGTVFAAAIRSRT